MIQSIVIDNYAATMTFLTILLFLLLAIGNYKNWHPLAGSISGIVLAGILYGVFLLRSSEMGVAIIGLLQPLPLLTLSIISMALSFISSRNYHIVYTKLSLYVSWYYAIYSVIWLVGVNIFAFSIGFENPLDNLIVQIGGAVLLSLSLIGSLVIYFIGKSLFFSDYTNSHMVESILLFTYGVLTGANFGEIDSGVLLVDQPFHTYSLYIPNLLSLYGAITLFFIMLPYAMFSWIAFVHYREFKQRNWDVETIDPLVVTRLRMIFPVSVLFTVSIGIMFFILLSPFILSFPLPIGWNIWIGSSVFFIVSIFFFIALQTPERVRSFLLRS